MDTSPLLDVHGLCAGYGETKVLRGVELGVGPGEIVAVLGSNGRGNRAIRRRWMTYWLSCAAPGKREQKRFEEKIFASGFRGSLGMIVIFVSTNGASLLFPNHLS